MWLALAAAALVVIGMSALFVFQPSRIRNAAVNPTPDKSIAVLPFENRSEDKANAYFADGIQDEILTRLSKIADLKVISRTSTQHYKSTPENLSEIAKQLGVAHILEGSVQKSGDAVRVNVQLIKAANDSHLWAEAFDRKLTDIFAVESEIAKGIVESLQAKRTGREAQAIAVEPTNNPEAYDVYLRGLALETRSSSFDLTLVAQAVDFYERAVQLDPDFAIAWARLARADALLYFDKGDTARRDGAKRALENAQKLAPNLPETLLAVAYYQYWVLRDYRHAKATFGRVGEMLPGSSEAPRGLALIVRREGHWDQSISYVEQALALDPRNVDLLMDSAVVYAWLRQFQAALKLFDRALDIRPNDAAAMAQKADIYQAQGNLQEAAKLLSQISAQSPSEDALSTKLDQLRLERNYGEAVRLLQASAKASAAWQVWLALLQRVAGDTAGANVTAESARNTLEQLYKDQQDDFHRAGTAAQLSLAYAVMGQKDSALQAAERAIALCPRHENPVLGPAFEENLALIQTIFGENSRAISTLTQLLQTPYKSFVYNVAPITPALLRLDPIWDPLRSDPAFQKLYEEKQP
jgi:TolB-like protein/Tfp pilus assembly protein PilF